MMTFLIKLLIEFLYALIWMVTVILLAPFFIAIAIGGLAIVAIIAVVALIGLPGLLLYIWSDNLLN